MRFYEAFLRKSSGDLCRDSAKINVRREWTIDASKELDESDLRPQAFMVDRKNENCKEIQRTTTAYCSPVSARQVDLPPRCGNEMVKSA
jgi:hypothetical protein